MGAETLSSSAIVAEFPFHSAGRRFVRKFGFAFMWAAFFAGTLGGFVYYRVPRAALEESLPWYGRLRGALERVELFALDWLIREQGARAEPADLVVPVTLDDVTIASARESSWPQVASQPWAREALGGLFEQLTRERARLTIVDLPLASPSPRTCAVSDDELFRKLLDGSPAGSLLPFTWSRAASRPPDRELRPYLVQLGSFESRDRALEAVRRLLAERFAAYLVPEGAGVALWAGASSDAGARGLAEARGLKGTKVLVRTRTAADGAHEVTPIRLLEWLAAVEVEGLSADKLTRARNLEAPTVALLSPASLFGATTLSLDADGAVRTYPHLVRIEAEDRTFILPSAPLSAAMALAGSKKLVYADGILTVGGKYRIPMDASGHSLLRWDAAEAGRSGRGSLKRAVSAWRVWTNLTDHWSRRGLVHHDNDLEEKVVVLADITQSSTDKYWTPIGATPGGAVLGQALVNILRSEGLRRADPLLDWMATAMMALIGAALAVVFPRFFRRDSVLVYLLWLSVASAVYLFAVRTYFLGASEWVAVATPILAMSATFLTSVGYTSTLERGLRDFIYTALGRAAAPGVARRVESDIALMRPERRWVTACYTDLEGFSELTQKLSPVQLAQFLKEYFTEMTDAIHDTGGQVDKYVGDSVLAFWGAPLRLDSHAEAACEAALRMQERLDVRRPQWEKRFGCRVEVRIGLNTGEAVVGDMGSERMANYTVLGVPVAMAKKLEDLNKRFATSILVSQATYGAAASVFAFREVERLPLVGQAAEGLYELMGRKKDLPEPVATKLARFEVAHAAYRARRFDEAEGLFAACAEAFKDKVSALYVERCRQARLEVSAATPESAPSAPRSKSSSSA